MNINETEIYEALGLSAEEGAAGGEEQDVADPAPMPLAESDEGGEEQDVADPAQDSGTAFELYGGTLDEGDGAGQREPGAQQTKQEINEKAAQRRRQEQQAAIDAAVRQAIEAERDKQRTDMQKFFTAAQIKNPQTGAVISTMEDFEEWRKNYEATQLAAALKAGQLTPDVLDKVISENPVIRKAEELIRLGEEERRNHEIAAAKARVDAELAEIQKIDATITSVADILEMPTGKDFFEYVQRGNTFLDAYYLANRERLTSAATSAAKQQVISNTRGKSHLTATSTRGAGALTVPPDELALFREIMPDVADAEIQAYYNKQKKK